MYRRRGGRGPVGPAPFVNPVTLASYLASEDASDDLDGTQAWVGQRFTAASPADVTAGTGRFRNVTGNVGSVVEAVFTWTGTLPGTLIGASDPVACSTFVGAFTTVPFTWSTPLNLPAAGEYVRAYGVSGGPAIQFRAGTASATGLVIYAMTSGVWAAHSGDRGLWGTLAGLD